MQPEPASKNLSFRWPARLLAALFMAVVLLPHTANAQQYDRFQRYPEPSGNRGGYNCTEPRMIGYASWGSKVCKIMAQYCYEGDGTGRQKQHIWYDGCVYESLD